MGEKRLWVLRRGGSPDHRERSERERETGRKNKCAEGTAQEKLFPKTTDWEKESGCTAQLEKLACTKT